MTCIVGLVNKGKVWIGGDSSVSSGNSQYPITAEKVFRVGEFLMGVAGTISTIQELKYVFKPPQYKGGDITKFMVAKFIPAIKKCLQDILSDDDPFGIVVALKNKLFSIDMGFSVCESSTDYDITGCGDDIARGVLFATPDLSPEKRITLALEAAEKFTCFVRKPFFIKKL